MNPKVVFCSVQNDCEIWWSDMPSKYFTLYFINVQIFALCNTVRVPRIKRLLIIHAVPRGQFWKAPLSKMASPHVFHSIE